MNTPLTFPGPRGPNRHHLAIRLADEGVPVAAIARAMNRPFGEVADTIRAALHAGEIAAKPPTDWPPGTVRYAPPAERITIPIGNGPSALEEATSAIPITFGLTRAEAKIVAAMMLRDLATKNYLYSALYGIDLDGGAAPKIMDVFVCKIRRKLAPHDIEIATVWGRGYRIAPDGKARLVEFRRAEMAVSATPRDLAKSEASYHQSHPD